MEKAKIIKIDSDVSYVFYDEKIYSCFAQGKIKKQKPLVGEIVELEILDKNKNIGNIVKIFDRKNEIYRPKICNIDQVAIIMSLKEPNFSSYLLCKYISMIISQGIKPIIVFTKKDLLTNSKEDSLLLEKIKYFKSQNIFISMLNTQNIDEKEFKELKKMMNNKLTLMAGQTGAGKSSTINLFLKNEKQLRTQEISKTLNRGKHTTTSSEIHIIDSSILLADSPGFSSFNLKDYNSINFAKDFFAFESQIGLCKFTDCIHLKEKECEVKRLTGSKIPEFIYEDYKKIQEEILLEKRGY